MEKTYIVDGNAAKKPAEDLSAFLSAIGADEKTRLIGITKTELAALRRGASLLLCVAVTDQPIVAGQELVAIVGYKPGDAPRMDTERVRLRVKGESYKTDAMSLSPTEVAQITGRPRTNRKASIKQLGKHWDALALEGGGFDYDTKLALPAEVIP